MSPAEHVLERIRTLTAELEAVQADIYGETRDPAEMLAGRMILEHEAAAPVLEEFRAALDRIRNVLWLSTAEAAARPETAQKRHRVAHAEAMLRTLSTNSRADVANLRLQTRETISFFDRLDRVIDNYMQEGGTIADPNPGKRPKT